MIRIIKDGKRHQKMKTIWKFKCPYCGCEFECELEDFAIIERKPGGDKSIHCPCCHLELHTNKNFYKTREVAVLVED